MHRLFALLLAILIASLPAAAAAQQEDDRGGLALRINGDFTLAEDERLSALVVINGDAVVAGTISDFMLVINGDATVSGTVERDVTMINGTLTLEPDAVVDDVSLVRSDLVEEPGATVTGDVTRTTRWIFLSTGALILVGIAFWVAMTFTVLVAGLVFAAVAGRQLSQAASLMTDRAGQSILSGLIVLFGLPIIAVFAMLTIVGIPLGIGMLLFLLPALTFLGYIVAGTWLGSLMLSRTPAGGFSERPFAQAVAGLLVLQIIILIPGVAPLVFIVGGVWGTGGLVYLAFRNLRGAGGTPPSAPAPAAGQPAP